VNSRCAPQEPQARGRQGAQKVAGAGPRGPNLATEKRARNQSREARAAMGSVRKHGVEVARAAGGGGGGIRPPWQPRFCSWCPRAAASPPAHRLNAAAPATTTVLGICRSASSSCCSGPWRSLEPCVFHESVTIVRVGSVGCWFAFIIVYHSVRIIYVSCA